MLLLQCVWPWLVMNLYCCHRFYLDVLLWLWSTSSGVSELEQYFIMSCINQFFKWMQIKDANRLAQKIQPYDEQEAQSQVTPQL